MLGGGLMLGRGSYARRKVLGFFCSRMREGVLRCP